MSRLRRLLTTLVAFGALAGLLAASASGAASSMPITLEYTSGGVLLVITADGTTIRTSSAPGAVISPGAYQVIINNDVSDTTDIQHQFRLQGPGVSLQTDMAAGDNRTELYDVTLAPSSTYTFSDDRQPSLAHVVFSTASSASAAGSSGSSSHGSSAGSSSGTSKNSDIAGSGVKAAAPFRGKLAASVGAAGKVTLTAGGARVLKLRSGRYSITVVDRTSKGGFTLQEIRKPAIALTGPSFIGTRTVTVNLTAGQWMFYSSPGNKSYFTAIN
jgi:hypothetical protein